MTDRHTDTRTQPFIVKDIILRFEVRNNWNNLDEITVEDELEALT